MRKLEAFVGVSAALACLFAASAPRVATAGFDPAWPANWSLRPEERCGAVEGTPDCQPLFWDLPAATAEGQEAPAAPLADPRFADFRGGMTDRPPPLYTDGIEGYENPGPGRTALCPVPGDPSRADPTRVPHWQPTGETEVVGGSEAEIFRVTCEYGSRAYYGPFFLGQDPKTFDLLAYKVLRFETSERLDAFGGERRELNFASEIYGHVGSHHGTCYVSTDRCADANDPTYANSPACDGFREIADLCPAQDASTDCPPAQTTHGFVAFRSTTARQGRYRMELPQDPPPLKAFGVTEDPLWMCQSHIVAEEPGYAGGPRRDFRKQAGGTVGELVVQILTKPWAADGFVPVSTAHDFVASAATTLIPPFTIASQETLWYAPFDLAIGMATMHSHENMVKGTIDVVPATAPRLESPNPACGGSAFIPAAHPYENYSYFEPEVCEYWRDPDGPIVLRKGQAIRASCIINNGVTPTTHIGDPAVRAAIEESLLGQEVLYGRQDPSAYRVRYGCEETPGIPPGRPVDHARDCPPNPEADATGGVVDGPYTPADPAYCPVNEGYTGRCVPANVVFSNTGEDSMCIPILTYWPLERVLDSSGAPNEEAIDRAAAGDVDEVGTPGRLWKSPSDSGTCNDGSADGPGVADPGLVPPNRSRSCRAGL